MQLPLLWIICYESYVNFFSQKSCQPYDKWTDKYDQKLWERICSLKWFSGIICDCVLVQTDISINITTWWISLPQHMKIIFEKILVRKVDEKGHGFLIAKKNFRFHLWKMLLVHISWRSPENLFGIAAMRLKYIPYSVQILRVYARHL